MRSNVVRRTGWHLILAGTALTALGACTAEAPVPAKPTWVDVEPILRGNCFHCHGGGGRPTNDAAAPAGALRWDFYDPSEATQATMGTFDTTAAKVHILIFLSPDTSPTTPNLFGYNYMPPPPGDKLTDREMQVLKGWAASGYPKGTRTNNHRPTVVWLDKPNSIEVVDDDLDPVLGTLTCGSTTIILVRSGGWPMNGMTAPCTAKLYDGFESNTVTLNP
jgi:hypothetical protein